MYLILMFYSTGFAFIFLLLCSLVCFEGFIYVLLLCKELKVSSFYRFIILNYLFILYLLHARIAPLQLVKKCYLLTLDFYL